MVRRTPERPLATESPALARGVVLLAFVIVARSGFAQTVQQAMHTPACVAGQLSLSFDGENGNFDSPSHSGTLVVLRNVGAAACSLLPKPSFTFLDAQHQAIALSWRAPIGMHPGPVMLPIVIPAGAEVTAAMQWVAGPVFDSNTCVDPAFLTLPLDGGKLTVPFRAHICGETGKPLTYDLQRLQRDPAYTPSKP